MEYRFLIAPMSSDLKFTEFLKRIIFVVIAFLDFFSLYRISMIDKFRIVIALLLVSILGYCGWRGYHYFLDTTPPTLIIKGIEEGGYYADDVECILSGHDDFKVSSLSVALDGKPLITNYKINSRRFEHPFTISTRTLTNGKHVLHVDVVNGTYARKAIAKECTFFVDNSSLQAAFVRPEADYKVFQGRTLHIQFQVNKELSKATVHALSQSYECFPESKNSLIYECFIPTVCEEVPNEYVLTIEAVDKVGNTITLDAKFQVIMYPFKKQSLTVKQEKVEAEKELGLPMQALEDQLVEVTRNSPKEKLWHGAFYPPIEIKTISTDFGVVRTTQERGRYAHTAVDILNTPKSVVWATQDGIVVIKDRFVHSGNTIVIDHGYGVLSMFFHLDSFANISVGDKIKRGNPVGTLGMTGYASGYHLHWEMRVNNIPVDPMQWIKQDF